MMYDSESECQGSVPVSTKVDPQMRDLLDEMADYRGITRSELLRRLFDTVTVPRVLLFRVVRDDERTRLDDTDDLLGWGVQFPSGMCAVEWNRDAFPEDDRLDYDHVSLYGSVDDVEQGTGGNVVRTGGMNADE